VLRVQPEGLATPPDVKKEFGIDPAGSEPTAACFARGFRQYMLHREYSLTGIFYLGHITARMIETLQALAEPNRFQIVELLRGGPRPVGDMVQRLGLRQPQVSKHLRVLSKAGLVDVRVDAQRRIYGLRAAPLRELEQWIERYRRVWEGNFQRLDTVLEELKTKEKKRGSKKRKSAY
jgi:DNA-binding transcriptional ArsR family regulator